MRTQASDLQFIGQFLENLLVFQSLKEQKWAKVEESVQEDILPGSPTEDYIRPPDENHVYHLLKKDPKYVELRAKIEEDLPRIKEIAVRLNYDTHHNFDWLNFNNPLIGQSALEDAISTVEGLLNYARE